MASSTTMGRSGLRRVFDFAFEVRGEMRMVLAYACGVGLLTLATPIAVQVLINTVAVGNLLQPLVGVLVLLAVALSFSAALEVLQVWLVELLSRRLFLDVGQRFAAALTQAPQQRGRRLVDQANRFMDVVVLQKSASALLLDGSAVVLQVTLGLALLAAYHPTLLAFAAGIGAFLLLVVIPLGRGASATALSESTEKYSLLSALQQLSEGDALRRFGGFSGFPEDLVANRSRAWLQARSQHFSVVMRQKLSLWLLQVGASVALLGIGAWLVRKDQLTLGQLVAAELVMTLTVGSLAKAGKLLPKLYDLSASLSKLDSVMMLTSPPGGQAPLESAALEVHLPSVGTYALHAGVHHVIPASAQISREFAEFVAPSPDAEVGVLLNEAPVHEYDFNALRGHILLLRDRQFFFGTVWQNLCALASPANAAAAQREHPPLDRARAAATLRRIGIPASDLDAWISTEELSPEQRSRLLVAAAVLAQPRILLVDRILDGLLPSVARELEQVVLAQDAPWTAIVSTVSAHSTNTPKAVTSPVPGESPLPTMTSGRIQSTVSLSHSLGDPQQ